MTDLTLIRDLGCVWLAALLAGFLCIRFKQPVIAGYVLAGVAIGPHGASLINNTEQIETLAELGVALLLFVLGLEVSFKKVFSSAKRVFAAGLGQLIFTMICAWIFASLAGLIIEPDDGFIFGCICALSSTVVASKLLSERGEADSAHGRVLVAILLIQDISLVPIIALLPALNPAAGEGMSSMSSFLPALIIALSKAALLVAIILLGATRVVPYLLKWVTRTNSREVFLLSLITLCISIALSSQHLGLSLALGAFLAGAMISESPYGHQALADLLPVKDLFSTVFFVSVGMLLNPTYIIEHPIQVVSFVLLLLVGKAAIGALCARVAIASWWSAIIVGVGLAQIGEFSFVLATVAHSLHFLPQNVYELILAGAVITLIISPLLMSIVPKLLWRYALINSQTDKGESKGIGQQMAGHVIICGYGRIGRNVGIALRSLDIPLVVIDINSETIEELEKEGVPCIYGDVFGRQVLLKAGLNTAAALVLTVPDPTAAMTIISFIRHHNQDIKIIARAHRSDDIEIFRAIGANAVVQPEFESSIEITRLALLSLTSDHSTIEKALFEIETERYKIFQHDLPEMPRLDTTNERESFSGNWFAINNLDTSHDADKRTIGSLDIRNKTGATVLAIKRIDLTIAHPTPDETIYEGDALYVAGSPEQLKAFETLLNASRFCPNI